MKNIIITGANGNLGIACVEKMLAEGHTVIAVDGANNHLEAAASHPNFHYEKVNLGSEEETASFVSEVIKKYQQIDAALLLVGGFAAGTLQDTSGADVDKMVSVNFKTAYFLARPLLEHMKAGTYGRLLFVGARPALLPAQGKDLLAYALSKSMLFTLAEIINEDCKGHNVTASVIVPSTIDTALNRKSMPDVDPANWVTPAALAETMAFVVSEKGNALREPIFKVYNNA